MMDDFDMFDDPPEPSTSAQRSHVIFSDDLQAGEFIVLHSYSRAEQLTIRFSSNDNRSSIAAAEANSGESDSRTKTFPKG